MNKCVLSGNIGKEIEIRYSNEIAIAKFSLAVRRRFAKKGEQDTDWFNVTTFGKLSEFCEKYLHKGSKIILVGRIANNTYTDKEGNNRYSTEILAEEIDFASSKKDEEAEIPANNTPADNGFENADDGFTQVDNSDLEGLPFN